VSDPKELSFGEMLQGDPEYSEAIKRKLAAQAMMQSILPKTPQTFKRSPIAMIADMIALRQNKGQMEAASEAEKALYLKHKAAETSGVEELLRGFSPQQKALQGPMPEGAPTEALPPVEIPADPRQAIMKAMTSQYPTVKKLGGELFKQRNDQWGKLASLPGVDPQSALSSGGDPGKLSIATPEPSSLQTFDTPGDGIVSAIKTPQGPGLPPKLQVVQKPAQVKAEANAGLKGAADDVLSQAGKDFGFGGKKAEAADALRQKLANTTNLLGVIGQAQMGSGAEVFQEARKFAQTLGMPVSDATTPTELARMGLGQAVMDELGSLGAQISDADRKFMAQVQGSLTTDKRAMEMMLLWRAKKSMETLNRMQASVKEISQHPIFSKAQMPWPSYTGSFTAPEHLANDFEALWQGKPLQYAPPQLAPARRPNGRPLPPGIERVN